MQRRLTAGTVCAGLVVAGLVGGVGAQAQPAPVAPPDTAALRAQYEKWRTEWEDSQIDPPAHCVIDETPLGNYAELEGPSDWIDRLTVLLGIAPDQQLTLSYGRLFEQWKEETGSNAQDLTFAAVQETQAR